MIFLKPELAEPAGKNPQLMDWVFKSLRSPIWNDLKMHVLGFLNTLLMSSLKNRLEFGEMDAVAVVVNALSSLEEDFIPDEEYLLQTLFSCLLFLLEFHENIVKFVKAGGVQSMIGIIQQEDFGYCYGSAIAALDIAMKACKSASKEFVNDKLAFDIAFPPYMDMVALITKTERDSLVKKLEENDFKRITWLMELYKRYSEKAEGMTNHLKGKQVALFTCLFLMISALSLSVLMSNILYPCLSLLHMDSPRFRSALFLQSRFDVVIVMNITTEKTIWIILLDHEIIIK
ncbi:uncharacterized protein LOC113291203 [Papaver somniferum]|uniref:uncharacterized protein LOC113291203 n=1 Tax=Papaver somniferum TaxID=3469 RepID=UPI000E6FC4F1|nr:uncharacterized protein LOC113291203 [Papaver somniferum]